MLILRASQSALVLLAVIAWVGGQLLGGLIIFGFSFTAVATVSSLCLAFSAILSGLATRQVRITNFFPRNQTTLLITGFGLSATILVGFIVQPSWDGLQSLLAMVATIAVALAGTQIGNFRPIRTILFLSVVAVLVFSSALAILNFVVEVASPSLRWRDRGEILVLAACITPLVSRDPVFRSAMVSVFSLLVILSDSRSSVLAMALVLGLWAFTQLSPKRPWRRILLCALAGGLYMLLSVLVSRVLDLRKFWSVNVPDEQLEGNYSFTDFVNGASSGRTEVWMHLLSQLNGPTALLVGKAPGFSAKSGQTVNPSFTKPHNEFLRMLVDSGLLGLGLFLLLLLLTLRIFLLRVFRRPDSAATSGLLLLSALLVHSFFSNTLLYPYYFLPTALVIGILLNDKLRT